MKARFAWLALMGALATPAEAQQRWCFVSNEGATDCSFGSMDLCRQTAAGSGGFCMPEAPIGHRQPMTSAGARPAPRDASDRRLDQTNRRLDRELRICRNC